MYRDSWVQDEAPGMGQVTKSPQEGVRGPSEGEGFCTNISPYLYCIAGQFAGMLCCSCTSQVVSCLGPNSSEYDAPTELFSMGAFSPIAPKKSAPMATVF